MLEIVASQRKGCSSGLPFLSSDRLTDWTIRCIRHAKYWLVAVGLEPPAVLMLTLLGMKGWEIGDSTQVWQRDPTPFDRDPLFLPNVLIRTFDQDADQDAKPLIDAAWQAAGWLCSSDYDDEGRWKERKRVL